MPALCWLASFAGWTTILKAMCRDLCNLVPDDELLCANENEAGQVGMLSDQQAFRIQELSRFRKTTAWLAAPATPPKLIACTLALKFAVQMLGKFFEGARQFDADDAGADELQPQTLLPLLHDGSPARQAMRGYLLVLGDSAHSFWRPMALLGSQACIDMHRCPSGQSCLTFSNALFWPLRDGLGGLHICLQMLSMWSRWQGSERLPHNSGTLQLAALTRCLAGCDRKSNTRPSDDDS